MPLVATATRGSTAGSIRSGPFRQPPRPALVQTQLQTQLADGHWQPVKTYPNPLLAYIAARKLSRIEQRSCRTICNNGQILDEIGPI